MPDRMIVTRQKPCWKFHSAALHPTAGRWRGIRRY